jgi:hypothetical protein
MNVLFLPSIGGKSCSSIALRLRSLVWFDPAAADELSVNRDQFIRKLRKFARKNNLEFVMESNRGKGSHYLVGLNGRFTTVHHELTPGRIERICKQLGISSGESLVSGVTNR